MVNDLSDQRKGKYVLTPKSEWVKIKAVWETAPDKPTFRALAKIYGFDRTTIQQRAKREGWQRKDSLALATVRAVENESKTIVAETAAIVGKQLRADLQNSLAPWLEREKAKHVRTQVHRAKRALKQIDSHVQPTVSLSPKDSAFIARAADQWDTIARRNLGMNDGSPTAGSLNLNILTNHSAVQINPSTGTGTEPA